MLKSRERMRGVGSGLKLVVLRGRGSGRSWLPRFFLRFWEGPLFCTTLVVDGRMLFHRKYLDRCLNKNSTLRLFGSEEADGPGGKDHASSPNNAGAEHS